MMPCYGRNAVGTPIVPGCQDVRTQFPAQQGSSLIVQVRDGWIVQQLWIKFGPLDCDPADGAPALEASRPGEYIPDPALDGGWQPAFAPTAVQKPGRPVPQVGGSAPPAVARPFVQAGAHLRA